jgi:hypothetical protein
MQAALCGHLEVVNVLVRAGANKEKRDAVSVIYNLLRMQA